MATIFSSTAWKVTQRGAGANMSVDIAVGGGNIGLSSSAYPYWGFSDAINNKTVTAADPSNPRKDIVVAYVDLAIIDSTNPNNPGALKFAVVAGTPAGSPSDPSDPTIQAAVGASNPWIKLARIAVAAGASSIVNANITDLRRPIGWMGNLWGGASNTNGHTVPNVADDTVALLAAVQAFTNKSFDSTNTLTNVKLRNMSGWVDANETWTYSSYDSTNKTGIVTVPSDATLKYSKGMRVMFTNNSATQYGIITGVTSTTLTIYFGTDYSLTNSAITANSYSAQNAPFGFPLDPQKWTVKVTSTNDRSTTGITFTSFTDAITVPIGAWDLSWSGELLCSPAIDPSSARIAIVTLSDTALSGSSVTYDDLTATVRCKIGASTTNPVAAATVRCTMPINITSPTTYTLYGRASANSPTTTAQLSGSTGRTTILTAVCRYL